MSETQLSFSSFAPPVTPRIPIVEQFRNWKGQYPGVVLLFQSGNSYVCFDGDAEILAGVAGVGLSQSAETPTAGIPHYKLSGVLRKLMAAGHKVAICSQMAGERKASEVEA